MNKILFKPITLAIFIILSLSFIFSLKKSAQKSEQSASELRKVEQDIRNLSEEIENSRSKMDETQDPLYQESVFRNELLMQQEGEMVIQLPREAVQVEEEQKTESNEVTPSPWQEWKKVMFY